MEKEKILKAIQADRAVRRELVRQSHVAFCSIYFSHHITHPYAFFHKEMFSLTERYDKKLNVVMAFRGSGKSTILNLSNAIWSIVGKHQKKFVLIISKSGVQAQAHFENIKTELESNELLKQDLGPFRVSGTEWGGYSIELPRYNAKIMCIRSLQNIRGVKYKNMRPDLIICDDMEDITTVQDRDKNMRLYHWFLNEVMNIGDDKTNIVLLGNLLSPNSLMIQLKKIMLRGKLDGAYHAYPLLDNHNRILWPQRYSVEDILKIRGELPEKEGHEMYSMFDRDYRLNMSCMRAHGIKYVERPITNAAIKKEQFKITVPLWATGVISSFGEYISDPDGWDGETVVPNVGHKS